MSWDGDAYQERFDRLAAAGTDVHGEADFVVAYDPASVLDAGCGTGRVGIELGRRGIEVVGVDVDENMLAVARQRAPDIEWVAADLTELDLRTTTGQRRTFALVLLAGNVPLFTPPGTQAALVAGCARHVEPGGLLVAGFQLGHGPTPHGSRSRGYGLDAFDRDVHAAGGELVERFATWDRAPFPPTTGAAGYAVSVFVLT